ncbi:MAG: RelA/SpoT family protein [Prevotellaceae bacterium]|jgi:GTP pyrophosphokinase|nr:RelA/SpoT family protein [Prevotellaceae bacterium]
MESSEIKNRKNIYDAFAEFANDCNMMSEKDLMAIKKSFDIAVDCLSDYTRENGNPFIFHALYVAQIIVVELGLSSTSVVAMFLHEANIKSTNTIDMKPFGDDVCRIVEGLNKISKIDIKTTSLQADNFRKLIVSYSSDPRVTLVKLADRLEVMRSLLFFTPAKQMQKATETMLLYAPLAHQLGLYNLKGELENLAFKYLDNSAHRLVTNKLKSTTAEREKFIKDFLTPIANELNKNKFKYEIKSRTKTAYSVWRKMQAQQVNFEGVYDVFAIRIILDSEFENEKSDCWAVYSIVANIYEPDTKRLRDWVSRPKATGYESLHTTVSTADGKFVEVQIRTRRMDEIAEKGAAAHWKYKGVKQIQSTQDWLETVRELLEKSQIESTENIGKITETEIFVFTPNGDLRRLSKGATVLDFAFDIHTNIGAHCTGARVNGKNTTIREHLNTGDTVEVTTSKNQTPKADWLNFVVSSKAKSRIRAKLHEEEAKVARLGKEIMERRLKNWKLSTFEEAVTALTKYYKLKQGTDFYAMLGSEKINFSEVKDALQKLYSEPEKKTVEIVETKQPQKNKSTSYNSDYLIIDERLRGLSYHLAKCCNPIKGDDIFGFVTVNSGITIHSITCQNAARLLDQYPYRVLKAKWREGDEGSFIATIKLVGNDEIGILNRITETLQKINVDIRSVNVSSQKGGDFEGKIRVSVSSAKFLDHILHRLQQIKGILKVQRINQ